MGFGRIRYTFSYKHFVPLGLFCVEWLLTSPRLRIFASLRLFFFFPLPLFPASPFFRFDRAQPIRARHVDRPYGQSMSLRILDEGKRLIKTHRLVVENCGGERRQIMTLQISAGIS